MKIELAMLGAVLLAAAAPVEDRWRPPPRPPLGPDWLRGGAEPEAVYGPRRTTVPERTLADRVADDPVRPRTALPERIENTAAKAGAAPAP